MYFKFISSAFFHILAFNNSSLQNVIKSKLER